MFDIEYKGANAVVLSTKNTMAVFDGELKSVGLKDIKPKNAVQIATEDRLALRNVDEKVSINSPGEYEVGDLSIKGVPAQRHIDSAEADKAATVYRVEVGDVRIAVLGNIAPNLGDQQLEDLGVIDILILPVGGSGLTLDATSAVAIVRQVGPKVVVPVHYADSHITYEMPQDEFETFAKELAAPVETTSKYRIKSAAALPQVLTVMEITRTA